MMRVAVLDDYQGASAEFGPWRTIPDVEVVAFADHVGEHDELVARLRHFDVVVAMRERTEFPRELLERLTDLRMIVTTGYKNAAINVAAATDCGILVSGTGGIFPPTVELTWGLIIGVLRNIYEEHSGIRAGGWQHTIGGDLFGSTFGVVGLGHMGIPMARIAKAFGMEVVAWSPNLSQERCDEYEIRCVSKHEMFSTADVITVHMPLSERSRGLIGREDFAVMKATAVFVNTARGPIVDEDALLEALRAGTFAGAAVDVYDPEPLAPHHPMRSCPRLLTTPHIGYVTRNTYKQFFKEIVENVAAYAEGSPIRLITHDD